MVTVVEPGAVLPDASLHETLIVYTRPVPPAARSARTWTPSLAGLVFGPGSLITQSGAVLPLPGPSTGSLLVTETIRHFGAVSQTSVAVAVIETGTRL